MYYSITHDETDKIILADREKRERERETKQQMRLMAWDCFFAFSAFSELFRLESLKIQCISLHIFEYIIWK